MGWLTDNAEKFSRATSDENGQGAHPMYRAHAVQARQIDELIGLVKGVLADGAICQGEIEFLLMWMNSNRDVKDEWPARALYPRIAEALADGHVDPNEESEIMSLLLAVVGGNQAPASGEASDATKLPLCSPAPQVVFPGQTFCFTGKFSSGSRAWCENQVHANGGLGVSGVTRKLDFLVIGDIGSRDWLHSTHGLKIKKAVDLREAGIPLKIIGEEHWFNSLGVQG